MSIKISVAFIFASLAIPALAAPQPPFGFQCTPCSSHSHHSHHSNSDFSSSSFSSDSSLSMTTSDPLTSLSISQISVSTSSEDSTSTSSDSSSTETSTTSFITPTPEKRNPIEIPPYLSSFFSEHSISVSLPHPSLSHHSQSFSFPSGSLSFSFPSEFSSFSFPTEFSSFSFPREFSTHSFPTPSLSLHTSLSGSDVSATASATFSPEILKRQEDFSSELSSFFSELSLSAPSTLLSSDISLPLPTDSAFSHLSSPSLSIPTALPSHSGSSLDLNSILEGPESLLSSLGSSLSSDLTAVGSVTSVNPSLETSLSGLPSESGSSLDLGVAVGTGGVGIAVRSYDQSELERLFCHCN